VHCPEAVFFFYRLFRFPNGTDRNFSGYRFLFWCFGPRPLSNFGLHAFFFRTVWFRKLPFVDPYCVELYAVPFLFFCVLPFVPFFRVRKKRDPFASRFFGDPAIPWLPFLSRDAVSDWFFPGAGASFCVVSEAMIFRTPVNSGRFADLIFVFFPLRFSFTAIERHFSQVRGCSAPILPLSEMIPLLLEKRSSSLVVPGRDPSFRTSLCRA